MQDISEDLKREHEMIAQELTELEVSFSSESINYQNLVHTFRRVIAIWDEHEKKEEDFFKDLSKKAYGIPYHQVLFEHGILGRQKNLLIRAMNSGSHNKIKESMDTVGKKMIDSLRKHMEMEDEVLYRLPIDLFTKE